jgi:hypothetical protein
MLVSRWLTILAAADVLAVAGFTASFDDSVGFWPVSLSVACQRFCLVSVLALILAAATFADTCHAGENCNGSAFPVLVGPPAMPYNLGTGARALSCPRLPT